MREAVATENLADGARRGPPQGAVVGVEVRHDLSRPPRGMTPSNLEQRIDEARFHLMRRGAWSSGAIGKAAQTFLAEAREPLVAGLPTDLVVPAQRRETRKSALVIPKELEPFSHGCRLAPGHPGVPPVPEFVRNCHPCSRSKVLPMSPVCTCVPPNPYQQRDDLPRGKWTRG